jgi:hypothetical protein
MNTSAEASPGPMGLINRGYYLFPCSNKKPLVKWREESTTDPIQIQEWIKQYHNCNWGLDCGKSGIFVLDDDRGKNAETINSLRALEDKYGKIPATFTVHTPSGGYHYYFVGSGRNSAGNKLGPGLDTRGEGGYVLAPCSVGYSIITDTDLVDAPEWMITLAGQIVDRPEPIPTPAIQLDSESAINLATAYLGSAPPALQGSGGDLTTFTVAAHLKDLGLSPEKTLELMLNLWNLRCEPPWDIEELHTKVSNAYRYGASQPGAANPSAVFSEYFEPAASPHFLEYNDLLSRDLKIDYLIANQIETPSTGLIFGDPSAGKSFQGVSLALAVATGTQWMGKKAKQGIAVYFAGEGRQGIQRRISAWKAYYKLDLPKNMMWVSERRLEFSAASLKISAAELASIRECTGQPIALIIVDTLARHMPNASDENSARDMGGFINACDWLRDQFNCVVAVVHHSGKSNKDNSRGSSALRGAMDWEMRVEGAPARSIQWVKQKESELPDPMGFVLEDVQITDEVKSAVPLVTGYNPTGGRIRDLSPQTARAFSALQFLISQSSLGAVTEDEWRTDYFAAMGGSKSIGSLRTAFSRAKKDLVDAKVIRYRGDFVMDNTLCSIESE